MKRIAAIIVGAYMLMYRLCLAYAARCTGPTPCSAFMQQLPEESTQTRRTKNDS